MATAVKKPAPKPAPVKAKPKPAAKPPPKLNLGTPPTPPKTITKTQAPAPVPAAPTPDPAVPVDSTGSSARDSLYNYLKTYGLEGFTDTAWAMSKQGQPIDQIMASLRASDTYKQIFGSNAADLLSKGIFTSEGQILGYHNQAKQWFHAYGINDATAQQYTNPDALNKLILGGVSPEELKQRLQDHQDAALASVNPEVRAEMARLGLGVTTGDLTSHWLDPTVGLAEAEQRFKAAQIGGASDRTGYGQLDVSTLMDLASRGVSTDAAQSGFSALAGESQLFTALPGQTQDAITQQQQLAAQFGGSAADQLAIERARRQRIGAFQGGGSAAADASGVSGLAPNAT